MAEYFSSFVLLLLRMCNCGIVRKVDERGFDRDRFIVFSLHEMANSNTPKTEDGDLATAILKKKAAPNKLIVDERSNFDESSACLISSALLDTLGLFKGDAVFLRGKKRKETVVMVLVDDDLEDNKIVLDRGTSFFSFFKFYAFYDLAYFNSC